MPIVEMLGPSGVGKSTLAKAVLERASASGWTDQYAAFARSQTSGKGWPSAELSLHRHLLALKTAGRLRPPSHAVIGEVETFQINMELAISVSTPDALVLTDAEFLHYAQGFDAAMMAFRDLLNQAGATSTVIDLRRGFTDAVEACHGFLLQVEQDMRRDRA